MSQKDTRVILGTALVIILLVSLAVIGVYPTTLAILVLVQYAGIFVGVVITGFLILGLFANMIHDVKSSNQEAENVRIVITSIASHSVKDTLFETISETVNEYTNYSVYCLIDEGADLEDKIDDLESVTTIIVPDDYTCNAEAKGRAINYFVENIVSDEPDYWYAFIDDDNRILDRSWLSEIPYYEEQGYVAMNPVLLPRKGDSMITFVADHVRYLDDILVFRTFTGIFKRAYVGFHGELLTVKGDVLRDVGFDRETIVEDYAFAMELIENDEDVWQSSTTVSILSPHSIEDFLKQRRRWLTGIAKYVPSTPFPANALIVLRMFAWSVSLASSWLIFPLIILFGVEIPLPIESIMVLGSVIFICTYLYGAYRVDGIKSIPLVLLFPVYAFLDQVTPLYTLLKRESSFTVIKK